MELACYTSGLTVLRYFFGLFMKQNKMIFVMVLFSLFFTMPFKVFSIEETSERVIKRIPVPFKNCGNGAVDKYEQCDDGNHKPKNGSWQ
jgi:hypothetical protein